MTAALPALLLGIANLGFRGPIPERALSFLAHVQEHGIPQVLAWIEDDPGLLLVPSWQFFYVP